MGQPAARLTDMHLCPMVTGLVPHVGGPISGPCCPTVLIGALPAARITDLCVCVGPPDVIVRGSAGVFIGGLPAARMLDNTVHGGVIVMGMPTVLIGETFAGGGGGGGAKAPGILEQIGQGIAEFIHDANMFLHGETVFSDAEKTGIEQALTDARSMLRTSIDDLDTWDASTQARFEKWFGTTDPAARDSMRDRLQKELDHMDSLDVTNFRRAEAGNDDCFAYVYHDREDTVYLGSLWNDAPATGADSKAGTLVHELSHFDSAGHSSDRDSSGALVYGQAASRQLALTDPATAQNHADNIEYFVERQ